MQKKLAPLILGMNFFIVFEGLHVIDKIEKPEFDMHVILVAPCSSLYSIQACDLLPAITSSEV